ncbi:MAG TPA: hypothetical protein VEY93_15960 [Longimicrobium sp.]|nr:hypothetical protein [Longimicrobium sp.]
MQRPALLMLVILAGCATRPTPPSAPARETGKLVRLSVLPSGTPKVAIISSRERACQTNDRMPNAAGGSLPSTARIPRSESAGTPVPMPNACPVIAWVGANPTVVTYAADSATAAPQPPR